MKTLVLLVFCCISIQSQMLTSVYFDYDSSKLTKESQKKLDSLANLKSNLKFRIFGNCDISGSLEYNKKLSENRANVVNKYLQPRIGNTITLESVVGLGKEKPINDNSTEELRSKNRRVDIFVDQVLKAGEIKSGRTFESFLSKKISDLKVGATYSLPNVNFIGGRHVWFPKGNKILIQLADVLKNNTSLEVELQGHICCDYDHFDGEDLDLKTFNLSWTRADVIREFLEKQGVDSQRIKVKGMGHLNPVIYPERTEEDMIKNRRVEIVVLKK